MRFPCGRPQAHWFARWRRRVPLHVGPRHRCACDLLPSALTFTPAVSLIDEADCSSASVVFSHSIRSPTKPVSLLPTHWTVLRPELSVLMAVHFSLTRPSAGGSMACNQPAVLDSLLGRSCVFIAVPTALSLPKYVYPSLYPLLSRLRPSHRTTCWPLMASPFRRLLIASCRLVRPS